MTEAPGPGQIPEKPASPPEGMNFDQAKAFKAATENPMAGAAEALGKQLTEDRQRREAEARAALEAANSNPNIISEMPDFGSQAPKS